jgi:AcrR family transcriptional regulator
MTTRERILEAAVAEFAEHGRAGARVARVAAAAGANKERIYHYFGSKDGLFDAVIEHATARIAAAEPFRADDLGAYVDAMLAFHRDHPELVRLLLAEGSERARDGAAARGRAAMPPGGAAAARGGAAAARGGPAAARGGPAAARDEQRSAHYAARVEAVAAAQHAGVLREDVEPRFVVFLLLATVVTAEAMPALTALILGDADLSDGVRQLLAVPSGP